MSVPVAAAAATGRWAEVDLGAVRANVRQLLGRLPDGCRLIAVVKADAYGHGARPVAGAVLEAGAWGLAVSTPEEALSLVDLCGGERLLIMGGLAPSSCEAAVRVGCAVVCSAPWMVEALEAVVPAGRRLPVHLEIDTGLHRLGCAEEEAPRLASRIAGSGRLRLAGTMTHFASSDSDPRFTRLQLERFLETLSRFDVDPGIRHAANSWAILRHPEAALDAVRPGIALYGCAGQLRPALALHALVTQVRDVRSGHSVGYGRTWIAPRPARIATVAIGYEDGIMRSRSNRGHVLVRGVRAPLVGRVSMDSITVDVSDVPDVEPGDPVTLIGGGITAEEVAAWSGTIPYEVLTSLGNRVARVYRETAERTVPTGDRARGQEE
ncbi:MAG TPA: alanine racemase [Candidatus Dormibacteraeota bacterium]|nr:alanine racemase [Candidatus Dormibacteraeota bacterium]